jgi:predicted NAD/FAD-dependent oxidoreductase
LALGLPACRTRRRAVTGSIVEGAEREAHRYLKDAGPLPTPGPKDEAEIVIVGAGVAGLSAAWALARAGVRGARVLELEAAPGGTAAWREGPVVPHPWGAHYVPVPTKQQRALCALLSESGVIDGFDPLGRAVAKENYLCRVPEERVFFRGHWSEGLYLRDGATAEDLRQRDRFLAETAALAARRDDEGRPAFALPLVGSAQDEDLLALDRMSMAQWLAEHGYDSPRLLWYVEYACRDDFGAGLKETSAWAGLHYFTARRTGAEAEVADVLTWPEGNGWLVKRLLTLSDARVAGRALVTGLEPRGGTVLVKWVDLAEGVARETVAEHVVLAVPRFVARRLLQALRAESEPFVHGPWAVANLVLDKAPVSRGYPQAWDNVLYESESLGYVVANHQADRAGREQVWTWYQPFAGPHVSAARTWMLAAPWTEWRDRVLKDLGPAHPDLEDRVVSLDVKRWGHAMVRPVPGFVWGAARRKAAEAQGRVHFAGCDVAGLPLFEEAQWTGVRAAEEILTAMGRSFESLL